MDGPRRIAWNLRRLRVERGLSQEGLAADSEVDRSYVGRLERAVENPTIGILERLSLAMSADISELFRMPRAGEMAPKALKGGRKQAKRTGTKRAKR